MSPARKTVVHLIVDLRVGGAEMMLYKLVSRTDASRFASHVISLRDVGPIGESISRLGIPVDAIEMTTLNFPAVMARLTRRLRELQPDIIQTWMYHSDLLASLLRLTLDDTRLIWNIRATKLTEGGVKPLTFVVAKMCSWLSTGIPDAIVCNSEEAARVHADFGYRSDKIVVIPNGFDLERFRPDAQARGRKRHEFAIADEDVVIGLVARFDPIKGHRTLIRAAARIARSHAHAIFVLCGPGIGWENQELVSWIDEHQLRDRFRLIGERSDIEEIFAMMDIAVSSSISEAFPNAVGEAMATGLPTVVTDVGDCALLVAECGRVVRPRDEEALADAMSEMISLPAELRREIGERARKRIAEYFSLDSVVRRYEDLYERVYARREGHS